MERMAKRARTSTGAEPPAGTSSVQEMITISPEPNPRHSPLRSPRHSPQREYFTLFPLARAGTVIFSANLPRRAGAEEQQGAPARDTSDVPPPSTTPPRGEPLGELHRAEEAPVAADSGNPSLDSGKLLAARNLPHWIFFLFVFLFLNLSRFSYAYLLGFQPPF